MIISYLKVQLGEEMYKYNFSEKYNLIFSKDNSKGKTTLIRFILYALGYQIPATEGIGSFEKCYFEISIKNFDKDYIIFRNGNNIELHMGETISNYVLPIQESELHSLLFDIDNISVIKNLLSTYYIDQEKGWTMLNRGKIIGNIRFNIEEFVAGVSDIDIEKLLDEKSMLSNELKKYRYFKNVIEINSEYDEFDTKDVYRTQELDQLLTQQRELEIKIKKAQKNIKSIEETILGNKAFSKLITDFDIIINHNGVEFILEENDLMGFNENQNILRVKQNNYKIQLEKDKRELKKIISVVNEKNVLFSLDSVAEELEKKVGTWGIDVSHIDKIITQLNNKRNKVNSQIKEKLSFNNNELIKFYEVINVYAKELGIKEYISDDSPKFVLTNKLKGLSGRILAQMAYIFKLSYIKIIEDKYNLFLPIIIDSPRTNELSVTSTNDMLKILHRDFNKHQIIIASIYKNDVIDSNIINLDDGLLSKMYKIN